MLDALDAATAGRGPLTNLDRRYVRVGASPKAPHTGPRHVLRPTSALVAWLTEGGRVLSPISTTLASSNRLPVDGLLQVHQQPHSCGRPLGLPSDQPLLKGNGTFATDPACPHAAERAVGLPSVSWQQHATHHAARWAVWDCQVYFIDSNGCVFSYKLSNHSTDKDRLL